MQSAAMTLLMPAGACDRSGRPIRLGHRAVAILSCAARASATAGSSPNTSTASACSDPAASAFITRDSRCAALAPKVIEGIATYADIVRRPHLPEDGFEAARDLALQALAGIEDEPRQKLMIKLREWHLPVALGRNTMGQKEHLEKLTLDLCQRRSRAPLSAEGRDHRDRGQHRFRRRLKREVEQALRRLEGEAAARRSS